ncbi:MAG: MiaB/RimO family radical SAM methylthiotransferase [Patescibacteria group bacterium]
MNYHIITYGCQMNYSDSERIAAILKLAKITPAKNIEEADLLIINSCSVRQSAINRIYGQLINFKKINKSGKTILTGCVLETDRKKFKDKFDLIIDIKELTNPKNDGLKKLLKLLNPLTDEREFKGFEYADYFKINPQYRSNFSAYIPIMTGCDNFCAYCAVPYTRGREISRPAEEIIKEVKKLIEKGYKEITLLGQNVNSYKSSIKYPVLSIKQNSKQVSFLSRNKIRDKLRQESITTLDIPKHTNPNNKSNPTNWIPAFAGMTKMLGAEKLINFPSILRFINNIPGNFWIRFLTSHPKDMSDELIETMAKCEKVCEYAHLPIQAGDNKILQKMNRRYTVAHYLKLIKKIKQTYNLGNLEARRPSELGRLASKLPSVAISTDIIVGFPGETKAQFANTAKIMRKVKFDMAYLAQYSPRAGTAAAKLKDNVSIAEKKRRKEFLNEILRKTALSNNKKYIGKIVEVLIEKIENKIAIGKTRTFKNVRIQNPPQSPFAKGEEKCAKKIPPFEKGRLGGIFLQSGQFAKVKITQASAWGLEGEVAENV